MNIPPSTLKFSRGVTDSLKSFPSELTPVEQSLRANLEAMVMMKAMLHIYTLHRGVYCKPAPLPSNIRKGKMGHCYSTAGELALSNTDELIYVEGYAMGIFPLQHAWCINAAGEVIDPTWDTPDNCAYFGIPVAPDFLRDRVLETGKWGIFGEMPSMATMQTPVETMIHPKWLDDISGRTRIPELENVLNRLTNA